MNSFVIVCVLIIVNTGSSKHQNSNITPNHHSKSKRPLDDPTKSLLPTNFTSSTYSAWTPWSRCQDCIQRRMKVCISPICYGSRMYEEKPCQKKRCKRKRRQEARFNIVHLNVSTSYLIKQAPADIWSRWSEWRPCSTDCRTSRKRICKKPGRCNKKQQLESAYCYQDKSNCEIYVLNLMDSRNKHHDATLFQYSNKDDGTIMNPPKKRKDSQRRCGIQNRKYKMFRIIGGREAKRYKWPWHVAVLNEYGEVFCGGTLISPRWVLTANHCIKINLKVLLNVHDLFAHDGTDLKLPVVKVFPHPRFNSLTVENDIALLMLSKAVKIPFACLPNKRPRTHEQCSAMGWGKTNQEDVYGVPVLREATLPIVDTKTCRKSYRELVYISDNMICAGWRSGRADTCNGDSGGGLMCSTKRKKRSVYSVQGITSFGDGCGRRNKYGIYTQVYNYVGWINNIIQHHS